MNRGAAGGPTAQGAAVGNGRRRGGQRTDFRMAPEHDGFLAFLQRLAASTADAPTMVNVAVRHLAETLNVDSSKYAELAQDGQTLVVRAAAGWEPPIVGERVPATSASQAGFTLEANEAVIFQDLAHTKRFTDAGLLRRHGVVSSLSAVVRGRARTFGVLSVHMRAQRDFTGAEARFLTAVGKALGAELERRAAD
jgi:GAF domain-containing protein